MPKRYRVDLYPRAQQDLASIYAYIARESPLTARRWTRSLRRQVRSLRMFPERWEVIPEHPEIGDLYRHLVYGNYRVIYRVEKDRVVVVRIIHAARLLERHMLPDA